MATSRAGEAALRNGPSPKCKWIFSKDEIQNMASLRYGLSEFKELQLRQQSTKFIQLLGDRLNTNLRDNRGKITQLCMCAAMIHMHRFFYFHSFTFFDYRDVAAACLFLSGKSEECPRKIDHIVKAWWSEKFPGIKLDQTKYEDAMGLLVAIESLILQTIAFDLQVALPHPLVLKAMHAIAKNNRQITEVVYFFSTDVLCVTSWGIRYSAEAIAVACVHIVCTWARFEMPAAVDGSKWYHKMDPTMTEDQLQEMMREFITVYKTCKNDLAITKFIKKGEIRDPISDGDSNPATPPALMNDDGLSMGRLPPPPPPPLSLASKKVDINAYKERRATEGGGGASGSSSYHHGGSSTSSAGGGSSSHSQSQSQPRRSNFMPEMTAVKGLSASDGLRNFVPPTQDLKDRKQDYEYRSSSQQQPQRPSRPPSNGSSSSSGGRQHEAVKQEYSHQPQPQRSSSSSHYPPPYSQQQPSGSVDRSLARDDRERSEKRKREMSSSNLQSEKRSRMDMSMQGSGSGQSQRGYPPSSSQQQSHGQYNSVPPPGMQQPPPMQPQPYGSSSKHYSSQQQQQSNGHYSQQPQRSHPYAAYGAPPPGYGAPQGMNGFPPHHPPQPPLPHMATTGGGGDMEDGEVF